MNAVMVPYRSRRALAGCRRSAAPVLGLSGLGASSRKRNGDAFGAAFPGINWKSDSEILLPAKFGNIKVDRGGFDELAGTWYGATYHPDGDQAGWQQKFDEALKKYGAYNAFYGVSASAPTPAPMPVPAINVAPIPTPTPTVQPSLPTVAPSPTGVPQGVALSSAPAFTLGNGYPVYYGSDGNYYQQIPGGFIRYTGPLPGAASTPAPTPTPTPTPTPATNVPAVMPPTSGGTDTSALIAQLMAQGASQQQAFAAAMQSLAAAGVPPTPQVQQQVANDVAAQSSKISPTYLVAGGVAGLILLALAMRGRRRRR